MPSGHPHSRLYTLEERFWLKVTKTDNCWNWNCPRRDKRGNPVAGSFWWDKRLRIISSAQASWIIHFGEIPIGLHVLHRCDNGPCVRPDHLFLGTHLDNMADRKAKGRGRSARGEDSPRARVTSDQVIEIRFAVENQILSTAELARKYCMSWSGMDAIRRGLTWPHLLAKHS